MRNLVVPGAEPGDPLLTNDGRGRAYGGELLVRQQLWHNFFGWVAYTLSRSERKDHPGEAWHRLPVRPDHILTLIASYKLPRGFQVGARYRYVTGNPYTPVVGAYYDANAIATRRSPGAPFSARLPSFNQLDLRVDKAWTFDRWRFSLYLDVQNVYRARPTRRRSSYNYNFTVPHPVSRPAAAADRGHPGRLLMTRRRLAADAVVMLARRWRAARRDDELPATLRRRAARARHQGRAAASRAGREHHRDGAGRRHAGGDAVGVLEPLPARAAAGRGGQPRLRRHGRRPLTSSRSATAPTITATMPADVTADALGEPDASGGVYLPLVARVTVGGADA